MTEKSFYPPIDSGSGILLFSGLNLNLTGPNAVSSCCVSFSLSTTYGGLFLFLQTMEVDFTQRWRERRAVFLQKQVFFNPRRHEVERISVRLAANWIIRNHYLGSFPSVTVCYGIFRSGELAGVAVLGTAQHKNTIPNVFSPSHAGDCLLLQRFALEDVLEFNAEGYFWARVRARLKREGYCGVLTMSDETPKTDALGNIIFPGHTGTIFKSDNAVYLGRTNRLVEYLFADGIVLSNRSFSKLVNNELGWHYMARKFEIYGASECPATASGRREWGFYWRDQLTRKQFNFRKLRYAWSLHLSRRVCLIRASVSQNCSKDFGDIDFGNELIRFILTFGANIEKKTEVQLYQQFDLHKLVSNSTQNTSAEQVKLRSSIH